MKVKRVLIATGVFYPEPITSAIMNYDLACRLSKSCQVTVITPKPSRPIGYDFSSVTTPKNGYKHIVVDSYVHPKSEIIGRFRESYSFSKKVVAYINKNHEDIDFVYNDGWQYIGLFMIAKACVKYGIPYMIPIQDIYPEAFVTKLPLKKIFRSIVWKMLAPIDLYYIKNAVCVRTISSGMARYLSKTRKISLDKFLIVANWQDDTSFNKQYMSEEEDRSIKIFMFAGNNNRNANVDLIIKAFVAAKLPNAELHIMGGGNEKMSCIRLSKDLAAESFVKFGEIPDGKVPEVQSRADVMVLALKTGSGQLGIPSKLTAYLFSGKPVIASVERDCDTAEIIKEAQCGIVTSADSIEELKNAFKQFALYTTDELNIMGINSRRFAESQLSRNSNLSKVASYIEEYDVSSSLPNRSKK